MHPGDKIVIGQEAVCPDGLGRVVEADGYFVRVETYVNNRRCLWFYGKVDLVEIRYADKEEHV